VNALAVVVLAPPTAPPLVDVRCPRCARLLFRGLFVGDIEIRCGKCDYLAKCSGVMQ